MVTLFVTQLLLLFVQSNFKFIATFCSEGPGSTLDTEEFYVGFYPF